MSESLIIVSSDTHVGPRLAEDLRPYCPAKYLDEFDAYTAANVEPIGSFGRAPGTGVPVPGRRAERGTGVAQAELPDRRPLRHSRPTSRHGLRRCRRRSDLPWQPERAA